MPLAAPKHDALVRALQEALGEGGLLISEAEVGAYSRDWSGEYSGRPLAVARPRSTAALANVVAVCREHDVPVIPQGGLTGLVGGGVARSGEVELVVSLERLDAIRSVDAENYSITVEAGCVLENAKRAAESHDRLLPISFGAQGSCRIGGNVATNAGGMNVLRYGMTRDLVLGLEIVLPDGRVLSRLNALRKDNRGYDLKQLFIGSEGTLGVVSAVALKLFPLPSRVETALVGLASVADAMALYARARRDCGDLLSAFELLLQEGVDIAVGACADLAPPLDGRYPAYVLMEAATSAAIDLKTLLVDFLGGSDDLVRDGVLAESRAQAQRLWLYREAMVEHQGRGGRYFRTDVSVRVSDLPAFVERAIAAVRARLPEALPVAYGHVGDGNVHLNVIPPEGLDNAGVDALFMNAEEVIFEVVDAFGGSISAEHGIGRAKREAFLSRVDRVTLDVMTALKRALDPADLMNPGRILLSRREAR